MDHRFSNIVFTLVVFLVLLGCLPEREEIQIPKEPDPVDLSSCYKGDILINPEDGCGDFGYPAIETSIYILPFPAGESYPTGLANCSSSYHAKGEGDQYAYDFNMPDNTNFYAIRAGKVVKVVEDRPNSYDGSVGNYVHIKHEDTTFALYYHSPPKGILVKEGDVVEQGQLLGKTGTSGYAGYPHLHLIVVQGDTEYPFKGVPISFKNVNPRHTVLKSYYESYAACEY